MNIVTRFIQTASVAQIAQSPHCRKICTRSRARRRDVPINKTTLLQGIGTLLRYGSCSFVLTLLTICASLHLTAAESAERPTEASRSIEADDDKAVSHPQHLFPLAEELSGATMIQKRDEYLRERGWALGFSPSNPDSAYIGWGQAGIQAEPDDVKFGQSRVLAFETAFIQARGDFVRFQQRFTTTETLRTIFQDSGDITKDEAADEVSRLRVIWEKVLALTDAKLDQALQDAGVDPSEFRRKPLEVRQKLLQDSISRTVKVRALQSVSGVRVLATFEDLNGVGVLIVYSDNLRDLAKSMLIGRTVARSNPAQQKASILKQIEAICPNGPKDLADVFGVRVMTDENGDRVLVSFGQWSPAVTKADSRFRRDTTVTAGRGQAMNLADGALTDFVNSTLSLESESSVWQHAELNRIIDPSGSEEVDSLAIGEALRTALKQSGTVTLQGVTTIKEWTANHPETGHLLVGHILMWSPTSRDAAIRGLKLPDAKQAKSQSRTNENKLRISPDFDKDADF